MEQIYLFIGYFVFWCASIYSVGWVFLYLLKVTVNKLGKVYPHLWLLVDYARNINDFKEWKRVNEVITYTDIPPLIYPAGSDLKPTPPEKFACYELEEPNSPANRCTIQCEECYARSIKFNEMKAEMRNAGNLYI